MSQQTHPKRTSVCLLTLCAMLVIGVGCGDDSGSNNATKDPSGGSNTSTGGSTSTSTSMSTGTGASTGPKAPETYQASYSTRFSEMRLLGGDKIRTYNTLNKIIAQNIKPGVQDPIVILAGFRQIDSEAGTLQLKAGAGLEDVSAGEYKWDPQTPDEYTSGVLDAATGVFSGKIDNFVFIAAVIGGDDKVPVKIRNIEFSGKLIQTDNAVQAEIVDGQMSGYITKADADTTMLVLFPGGEPQSLTSLLKEENLNLDTDNDSVNDSWKLEATYKAAPVLINE